MGVKKKYKLPFTLDTSTLDIELDLSSKNSNMSLSKRPITVKLFMFGVASASAWIMITMNTGIRNGSILAIALWSIAYFWVSFLLLSPTKTQMMGYSWVKPSLEYMLKVNRHVGTRGSDPSGPVEALVDVKAVGANGMILFNNKDVGEIYEVVGYGSVLMFDHDRDSVLADASDFYRNLPLGVTLIYDTQQAPQKVIEQRMHLRDQARNLKTKSKGLRALQRYENVALRDYVGKSFKSIHQLMIVRAIDKEHLESFHEHMTTLQGSNFIRSLAVYDQDDIYNYLKDLKGREL